MDVKNEFLGLLNAQKPQATDTCPISEVGISSAEQVWEKMRLFVDLLQEWNQKMNLVSKNSMADVWIRHVLDSAQLFPLLPIDMKQMVDIGSGAGFPAMVLAIVLQAKNPAAKIVLVESIAKKAAYLREVSEQLDLTNVRVINDRVENAVFKDVDVVTARAVAALDVLCGYVYKIKPVRTLFLKGQSYAAEDEEAQKHWIYRKKVYPNKYSENGVILELFDIRKKK